MTCETCGAYLHRTHLRRAVSDTHFPSESSLTLPVSTQRRGVMLIFLSLHCECGGGDEPVRCKEIGALPVWPVSSSPLTVISAENVPFVRLKLTTSPTTVPSTGPEPRVPVAPLVPALSTRRLPLTFGPCCSSSNCTASVALVRLIEPTHVPVTSAVTSVS
jgi:hypothetical protein